jgi:hypothetical protein
MPLLMAACPLMELPMAYQRPMVMVYQEYESTSVSTPAASLPPCIVGPCYHILDPVEDETLALFGTYTKAGVDSGMFPNNAPGALIDKDSVRFRFKNAMVVVADGFGPYATGQTMEVEEGSWGDDEDTGSTSGGGTGASASTSAPAAQLSGTNAYTVPGSKADKLKAVEVGDYAVFTDGTMLRVIGVNGGTLLLNRMYPADAGLSSVQRKIEEFYVSGDTAGKVFLDLTSERFTLTAITYAIGGVECAVDTAELYVGYRALRQDLSDINTIYSVDELKGVLGKITPENPLAFGVSIALANGSVGIQCIGVDSDDLAGYTAAKDRLEQQDPVYGIVPLTFDVGVLTMFKNHCEEYSDPKVSKWRMAFGCTRLEKVKTLCSSKGAVSRDGDGDLVVLRTKDASVEFLSSSVDAGDILLITDASGNEHVYTVASVASEDTLTITQSAPFDGTLFKPDGTEYAFTIRHEMDRDEQAKWIRDASKAYNYRRFVNIFPDVCVVDGEELPGYYLGCAVASGVASLPSHYGMTRLSVSGISAVKHSGDYFNNDQLDIIADGGTFIFVQATQTSAPYIRHQLTTDRSAIEFQELSFVKNFDYISYICRDVMDTFLGKWNITPATLGSMRTALNGTLETLKLDSQPKIGSRVLDYHIVSVQQLADVRDRVEMYAEVAMPYPLNTIGLHLKSVFLQISSS